MKYCPKCHAAKEDIFSFCFNVDLDSGDLLPEEELFGGRGDGR